MMESLRTAANSIVIKIIFGLIMLSFVLTGVGSYLVGGTKDYAVEVNGQKIPLSLYEQSVQTERARMQEQLGDKFSLLAGNEQYIKQMRTQVLDELINDVLLEQYAAKLNLIVSDEQIRETIRAFPAFQQGGKFDNNEYLMRISRMGFTAEGYAEYVRKQLTRNMLINNLLSTEFSLPAESQSLAELTLQIRDVRLATLDVLALAAKQEVSDAEIQDFYQKNTTKFIEPERLKVSYIELKAADFADKKTVSEQEIETYYNEHKQSFFESPAASKYQIIQVKTEGEAQSVITELKAGADFGKLVQEKSIDVIGKRTEGYTDWMAEGDIPDVIKQAKLTEKEPLSVPLKSGDSYLVVRFEESKPAIFKPLDKVKETIAAAISKERTLDGYFAAQNKLSDAAANDNASLQSAETALNVKAVTTDWFNQSTAPDALNNPLVLQTLFDGKLYDEQGNPQGNSDLITLDNEHSLIMRVNAYEKKQTKPLESVKEQVRVQIQREKASKVARATADEVLKALQAGKGDEALSAAGLAFGKKQEITRSSENTQLVEAVFALPHPVTGKATYGISQESSGDVVLIALDAVKPGVLTEAQREPFAAQMVKGVNGVIFENLISTLRQEAKMEWGRVEAER